LLSESFELLLLRAEDSDLLLPPLLRLEEPELAAGCLELPEVDALCEEEDPEDDL